MGLLDDAIREHLDLKRRRGADPDEVARLEHEALGPVRREPAGAEAKAAEAETPADVPAQQEGDAAAERPRPADGGLHPDEHAHVLAPEDRHEPPHGDPLVQRRVEAAPAPPPETPAAETPAPAPPAPEPAKPDETPRADVVDQPTTEYRLEDEHASEDGHASDDVLEETPDFLQETPEHDRLWFEQRPPRDFDFDG